VGCDKRPIDRSRQTSERDGSAEETRVARLGLFDVHLIIRTAMYLFSSLTIQYFFWIIVLVIFKTETWNIVKRGSLNYEFSEIDLNIIWS
jgi:hypothetical protein